jgi:hypothetical protein
MVILFLLGRRIQLMLIAGDPEVHICTVTYHGCNDVSYKPSSSPSHYSHCNTATILQVTSQERPPQFHSPEESKVMDVVTREAAAAVPK